jgi:DNA-binding NarL/FixJ family response regulator
MGDFLWAASRINLITKQEDAMAHEWILIVEDEKITGMDIRQMVREFGYEPIGPVASGEDAVTVALALRPHVILMDILLKGRMDGIQAAEAIRSKYSCPVIYVTAHSDQTTLDRARVMEPSGWILKPVDEEELHKAIERALYEQRIDKQSRESILSCSDSTDRAEDRCAGLG